MAVLAQLLLYGVFACSCSNPIPPNDPKGLCGIHSNPASCSFLVMANRNAVQHVLQFSSSYGSLDEMKKANIPKTGAFPYSSFLFGSWEGADCDLCFRLSRRPTNPVTLHKSSHIALPAHVLSLTVSLHRNPLEVTVSILGNGSNSSYAPYKLHRFFFWELEPY